MTDNNSGTINLNDARLISTELENTLKLMKRLTAFRDVISGDREEDILARNLLGRISPTLENLRTVMTDPAFQETLSRLQEISKEKDKREFGGGFGGGGFS